LNRGLRIIVRDKDISVLTLPVLITSIFVISTIDFMAPGSSMIVNIVMRASVSLLLVIYTLQSLYKKKRLRVYPLNLLLLLFITVYIVRLTYDANLGELERNPPVHYFYFIIIGSFIPLSCLVFVKDYNLNNVAKYIFYILLFASVVVLINIRGILGTEFGRLSREDTGLNPLIAGYLGSFLLVVSLGIYQKHKSIKVGIKYLIIGSILGFLCVAISGSRGPLIAVVIPLLVYGYYYYDNNVKRTTLILLLGVVGLLSIIALDAIGSMAFQRLTGTIDRIEGGREMRFIRFALIFKLISNNLVLGYGVELPGGSHPHNLILESFLALGVVGGVMFMYLYFTGVIISIKMIKFKIHTWLGMLFLTISIWALFSSTIYYLIPFWIILILIINTKYEYRFVKKKMPGDIRIRNSSL